MLIAIPTRNGLVDNHFGHCEYFTIFTAEGKNIISETTIESPEGCGCKSDIAPELAKRGVRILVGGNMGEGAKQVLESNGIKVFRGQSGNVRAVCERFLAGDVIDNEEVCRDHNCDSES